MKTTINHFIFEEYDSTGVYLVKLHLDIQGGNVNNFMFWSGSGWDELKGIRTFAELKSLYNMLHTVMEEYSE
jgi:hypothetical protein